MLRARVTRRPPSPHRQRGDLHHQHIVHLPGMSLGDGGLRCLDAHRGWQLVKEKNGTEWWQLLDSKTTQLTNVYDDNVASGL